MKIFGFEVSRQKNTEKAYQPVSNTARLFGSIRESFAGAWQQGVEIRQEDVVSFFAVYSCVTLIASDIGKLRIKLMRGDASGVSVESSMPVVSDVLRKPNRYQTRIKFIEQWMLSKLLQGNTYVLKQRNSAGGVSALYILDPTKVKPLVAEDGSVYYELGRDDLSQVSESVIVPASEIIHDTMVALYHPLVGVSPIYACGLAATQGMKIQQNSTKFFSNGSNPGGVLTAPGEISDETAARLKEYWEKNYTGNNVGKVAVLGDGLKYEAMTVTAVDAQLLDQLKLTAEMVCSCFHVPAYMVGAGPAPSYNNIEALNQQYYSQCLQSLLETAELLLAEGLSLPTDYSVSFDLDALLRMDTAARYKAHTDAIGGGWLTPNEARKRENLSPVAGGDTPYMQQQNYSLAALDARDRADPFAQPAPAQQNSFAVAAEQTRNSDEIGDFALEFLENIRKGLECEQN